MLILGRANRRKKQKLASNTSTKLGAKLLLVDSSTVGVVVVVLFLSQLAPSTQLTRSANNRHCDWDYCDSLVSKCTLTNRCTCKDFRKDASCAKDCIDCLEEKFGKCCACVELCPVFDNETHSSHVGFTAPAKGEYYPLLFENMTESDDIHGRWRVMRILSGLQMSHPKLGQVEFAYRKPLDPSDFDSDIYISHDPELDKLECHVAFINKYLSMARCKKTCTHMGATFYRWFHDGCCECVGRYCLNFGVGEPNCLIAEEAEL